MIYEYKCNKCNKLFDIMCRVSECTVERACPDCGTIAVRNYSNQNNMAIPHDRIGGRTKIPDGFNDVLQNIANKAVDGHLIKPNLRR